MNKSELRSHFLRLRRGLNTPDVARLSAEICDTLFREVVASRAKTVHCFISIPKFNEVDTSPIIGRFRREFPEIRIAAPRISKDLDELEHVYFRSESDLAENVWGIREPVGTETADPKEIDLVIVPLLCFDVAGHRVGYGKGFYDRFLRSCRVDCLKAGVSFFPPVDRIDDAHEGDFPIDLCVMPGSIVLPR